MHTKSVAKANRQPNSLLGNQLDLFIRNAQDGQTQGIPISPDTSALVAECILASTDQALVGQLPLNGFRYVDDYEIGFATYSEAENGLAVLQGVLSDYELQLNPRKTNIVELPCPLDSPWASELRVFLIRPRSQLNDLIHYFGRVFELAQSYSEEDVIKYSISRMNSVVVDQSNWDTYQDILCQCAMIEPGALSYVIDQNLRYAIASYTINKSKLKDVFSNLILTQAPLVRSSVVAWAVWGFILFDIPIDDQTARVLANLIQS